MNKGNYFLKAVGISESKQEKEGDRCFGCVFQTIRTEPSGRRRPVSFTQMGAMTLNRLALPHAMIGLGKTTNYIENFSIGIAKKQNWHKMWTPLIPNSEIFLFLVGSNPEKWKIEIFINPTQALYLILVITVLVIILLTIIAGVLHWREKKQDERERARQGFLPINL